LNVRPEKLRRRIEKVRAEIQVLNDMLFDGVISHGEYVKRSMMLYNKLALLEKDLRFYERRFKRHEEALR